MQAELPLVNEDTLTETILRWDESFSRGFMMADVMRDMLVEVVTETSEE